MPIYEYVCPGCKSKFELLRSISQANEGASCPRCHSQAERALSTFTCFAKGESQLTSSVGSSSCSGCNITSCDSCGL